MDEPLLVTQLYLNNLRMNMKETNPRLTYFKEEQLVARN